MDRSMVDVMLKYSKVFWNLIVLKFDCKIGVIIIVDKLKFVIVKFIVRFWYFL